MLSSHFPHTSCHPRALLLSLSLYPLPLSSCLSFSSTDNRQSSHAVHLLRFWRRPSESPNTLSRSRLAQISLWPFSIFLQPAYPSFLSSVIVYSYEYHSPPLLPPSLVCGPSLLNLISSLPVFSISVQCMFLNFSHDFKSAALSLIFFFLFQPLFPEPALHLFLLSIFPLPSSPNCLPCLPQDTAEYVAYVAKDPVNQRGECNDTFTQYRHYKNSYCCVADFFKALGMSRTLILWYLCCK